MVFAVRACSRATNTAERTCARRLHLSEVPLVRPFAKVSGETNSLWCTLATSCAYFGSIFQISSVVNTRIGASNRPSVLLICHTAVCADRREILRGALVY